MKNYLLNYSKKMKNRSLFFIVFLFLVFSANRTFAANYESLPLEDAFVNEQPAHVDNPLGAGTSGDRIKMYLKNQADGQRNAYLKLSLEELDKLSASDLENASIKLRLYVYRANSGADGQTLDVYPVSEQWNEETITWNNAPAINANGNPVSSLLTSTIQLSTSGQQGAIGDDFKENQWLFFDLTEYALAQYKAGNKLISIAITVQAVGNNGDIQIVSKDNEISTLGTNGEQKLPKLIINSDKIVLKNILKGGSMEKTDESNWTTANFSRGGYTAQWGITNNAPAAGSNGALQLQGSQEVQFAIFQAVELEANVAYHLNAAYNVIGEIVTSWVEFYIGNVDPNTLEDYTADNCGGAQVSSLLKWNVQPTNPDGTLKENANKKPSAFTPAQSGTYYVLVKVGCNGTNGNFNLLLDNVTLEYESIGGGSNIDLITKDYKIYSFDSQIKITSTSTISNVRIYTIDGILAESGNINSTEFNSSNLPKGIYIVNIDGKAEKVIVK